MCGIAGVYNFRTRRPVDLQALERMSEVQAHRGPDAAGRHVDVELGLAHRRLAIIDLDPRGRQPMSTPDGRYQLVLNGEIYNYIELRRNLLSQGQTFRTETDTEVLLTLYARDGLRCLQQLNGMFAFAVWDAQERSLLIARDRIGIKPLYYAESDAGLVFASEAKALFEYPGIACEPEQSLIRTYMAFGYIPGDKTLFRSVKKLLPAHCLVVNPRGIRCLRYWNVEYRADASRSSAETARELHRLLLDAARIHMRSDVPVGVFLSGGLDSSATVSLLAEAGMRSIQTFSVAYDAGGEFDETEYARRVAAYFSTKHHVLYVEPSEFRDFIPAYVWHMDEPVTEAAGISLFFISRLLKQHVTVALSGEGADELFAGYQIYRYMLWIERYRQLPSGPRAFIRRYLPAAPMSKLGKYLQSAEEPLERRYYGVSLPAFHNQSDLYGDDYNWSSQFSPESMLEHHYAYTAGQDPLTRMLYADLKTWLVDDLLIKADKMTMANAVELRVPFLDYRIVEFAATIPSSLKLRGSTVKWILKKAFGGKLPAETLRRRKVGFPTPLRRMFRADLADYLRDVLLASKARHRGYFRPATVDQLIASHISGSRDYHQLLWQLVVLEEWHKRFIDAPRRRGTEKNTGTLVRE